MGTFPHEPRPSNSRNMRAQIEIGRDPEGQSVPIDIEELLGTRLLVQSNSGSGKSNLLRWLLEQSAGLVQQVVIDPEGDFASLADKFDHIVIDGAAHSPAEIEALARRVRQHRASVVLALEELEVEQQIRCAALFLTALFDAPREHWYPALVVVDEAQMFAPAAAGEMAEDTRRLTLSAMTNLMCRGRKRGLAGVVATQRLAKLAKNVAAEASNFLMGRTFLDIDMQRAADLLGMDRKQAERIRDLQRGQFLGLGPAISRRPVAVQVGAAQTGGKNAGQGLMPLPETGGDELEALLHGELAQEAQANTPRVAAPKRKTVSEVEQAIVHRASLPLPPRPVEAKEAPTPPIASKAAPLEETETDTVDEPAQVSVERIVDDLARQEGATFRSPGTLFREFLTACRQHGVGSAHIDMGEFRRLFAFALSGTIRLSPPARATIERLAEGVDEDLAIAVAALQGRNRPDEDELARVYGSSSPGRIRRLLDHLERSNLIAVREDFGGARTISVLGLEDVRAD